MALRVQRTDPAQPVELRAFLQLGAQALSIEQNRSIGNYFFSATELCPR